MASSNHLNSLTTYLLSTHRAAYTKATKHPFLTRSGVGTLADSAVCEWLVQDKYYQLGYVNFIGSLLSKLDLSALVLPSHSHAEAEDQESRDEAEQQSRLRTTTDILSDSLVAIRQEIDFYDQTAKKYELELEYAEMSVATEEYVELFRKFRTEGKGTLQGLVVLWATEHVSLTALSFYPPSHELHMQRPDQLAR